MQAGLIIEGNTTRSAVLQLPHIPETLGPVKSRAVRVAGRVRSLLKAGYPVPDYEGLQAARPILIRAPDAVVPRIVDELAQSELVFTGLSFVLCESWLRAEVLDPLKTRGASVATLVTFPKNDPRWFVVEGSKVAVRHVKRFIEVNEGRALELRPGSKHFYFAAVLFAAVVPVPLFVAAQQSLRAAGVPGNHLYTLLDEMAQHMFNDFSKGARVRWGGPLVECSAETVRAYFDALRRDDPQIAELLSEELSRARRGMSKAKASAV